MHYTYILGACMYGLNVRFISDSLKWKCVVFVRVTQEKMFKKVKSKTTHCTKKRSFPIRISSVNPQETADLVTFTEEIRNEKPHFLYHDGWKIMIIVWKELYGKTRVTSYELQVTSWKLKSASWNSKEQVQIHELRVQIHESRDRIHENH